MPSELDKIKVKKFIEEKAKVLFQKDKKALSVTFQISILKDFYTEMVAGDLEEIVAVLQRETEGQIELVGLVAQELSPDVVVPHWELDPEDCIVEVKYHKEQRSSPLPLNSHLTLIYSPIKGQLISKINTTKTFDIESPIVSKAFELLVARNHAYVETKTLLELTQSKSAKSLNGIMRKYDKSIRDFFNIPFEIIENRDGFGYRVVEAITIEKEK